MRRYTLISIALLILLYASTLGLALVRTPGLILVRSPKVVTGQLDFSIQLDFSPTSFNSTQPWPATLNYLVYFIDEARSNRVVALTENTIQPYNHTIASPTAIKGINLSKVGRYLSGTYPIYLTLYSNESFMNTTTTTTTASGSSNSSSSSSSSSGQNYQDRFNVYVIPAWISILPSILTVVLAIALKQNVLALFAGVWLGATFLCGYNPATGLLRALDTLVIEGLMDRNRISVIYFCLLIGGMIAVIGKSGGAIGMANLLSKLAKNRVRSLLVTWCIGVLTFFDDYASCLITGSTMRDVTGQHRVSRAKLSFVVDTCAATISSLMIISSWIGFELVNIKDQLQFIGNTYDPYLAFLETIPYRFYPLLILFFCLVNILMDVDFGPMLAAERRAVQTGDLLPEGAKPLTSDNTVDDSSYLTPKEDKPCRWYNAVIPFGIVILTIVIGMIVEGYCVLNDKSELLRSEITIAQANGLAEHAATLQASLDDISFTMRAIFAASDSFHALIWASFGCASAIILAVAQRILTLNQAMDAWLAGTKSMIFAILILMHAWALSSTSTQLYTSDFIASGLVGSIPAGLLPTLVFVLAALVSFSTGSAWGTMALLFPLMIQLADQVAPNDWTIMLGTISSVLSGAVWGNHTSPISDSCIMSSLSTGADHTEHVRTQAVYALVVGFISIVTCSLPVGFGVYPMWAGLIIGCLVIVLLLLSFGRSPHSLEDARFPITLLLIKRAPWLVRAASRFSSWIRSTIVGRAWRRIFSKRNHGASLSPSTPAIDEETFLHKGQVDEKSDMKDDEPMAQKDHEK